MSSHSLLMLKSYVNSCDYVLMKKVVLVKHPEKFFQNFSSTCFCCFPFLIVSKKKFTDGLDSVFAANDPKDISGRGTSFLHDTFLAEAKRDDQPEARKSSARKTFTTDLDSLLEEALQESFREQTQPSADGKAKVFHQQTHRRRPLSGLDMFIRRTVEAGAIEIDNDETTGIKRLTVNFDREKLEKLKKIARMEKAYLKDILGDIVGEYIRRYETKKGALA